MIGESSPDAVRGGPTWETQVQDNFELHKATMEYCDIDLCKVSIIASRGERTVAGPPIHKVDGTKPLEPRSANMNTAVQLKRTTIGNCWDDGIVGKTAELIMEYPY